MLDRPGNINLYVLYAEEDESLKNELERHLSALQRQGYIDVWHDGKIAPGADVPSIQQQYLSKAHVILLLISANFLAPECYNKYEPELRTAFERQKKGEVKIIPVILRDCLWQLDLLASLKPLPAGGHPVRSSHWENQDKAFAHIARELQGVAREFLSAKQRLEQKVNQMAGHLIDYGIDKLEKARAQLQTDDTAGRAGEESDGSETTSPSGEAYTSRALPLLNQLFQILLQCPPETGAGECAPLVHSSLLADGRLEDNFRKHNFEVALKRARLYKLPVEIKEEKPTGRESLGFLSNRQQGKEIRYTLVRRSQVGSMPGYVRIFFPDNDEPPRISGLSL